MRLRSLREEDFESLYMAASDPLVWEQHPSPDRYKEEEFKLYFREAIESGGALTAIDSKDGRIIGTSRFHGFDPDKSPVEIGWTFLARSYWGGRYNGEMKRLMMQHAFQFVDTVIFVIGPQNLRSQKAIEKLGGVRSGTRLSRSGYENVIYEITRTTFEANFIRSAARESGRSG